MKPGTKVKLKDGEDAWVFPFDSFWGGVGFLVVFYVGEGCSAYIYDEEGRPCDERIIDDGAFDVDWDSV